MKKLFILFLLFVSAVQAQSSPTVTLNWFASTTAGATYQVYRELTAGACTLTSTGTGPGCVLLNATPLPAVASGAPMSYVDTGAPSSSPIFYVVKASAAGFTPAFSNEVAATLPVAAPAVTCQITITGGVVVGTCK